MKIFSEKVNYGLSAILELAKNYYKEHIQIKEIAMAQKIPQNYLEKLLINLKRAGLVESVRGAKGGYKLNKAPNEIRVIDLIKALEGSISITEYSKNIEVLQMFWREVEVKFRDLFNLTLEDLIKREKILNNKLSFQI